MRAGILTEDDIPPEIAEILGHSHSQRINTLVENMIDNTIATGTLGMQPEIAQAMDRLRTFMFARVYTNPVAKGEETKAKDMLCRLFEYYMRRPEKLPADFLPQLDFDGMEAYRLRLHRRYDRPLRGLQVFRALHPHDVADAVSTGISHLN